MQRFARQLRSLRDWWFQLCTGHSGFGPLNEELYRQRILVMTSCFLLFTVIALTLITPLLIELSPEGSFAAQILFVATAVGVVVSMLILRYMQNRIASLNVMLVIYTGAFVGACLFFGGTKSPTYPLLLLAPVMAGIVGSTGVAVFWSLAVLGFWLGILFLERSGFEFVQIIKPENHAPSMVTAFIAATI